MRLSVELDGALVKEVMAMTGESKMSAAIAKATELFAKRRKAAAIVRSLREQPLDYPWSNEQLEGWGEAETIPLREGSGTYRKNRKKSVKKS